jgi:hypothetical protein
LEESENSGKAVFPADLFENVLWRCDSLVDREREASRLKGALERALSHRNHATEKLGGWDAIICTAFANIPKKPLLSIRLLMSAIGARLQAFAPLGVFRAFNAPFKKARLI